MDARIETENLLNQEEPDQRTIVELKNESNEIMK
jgi:hypothetical protein